MPEGETLSLQDIIQQRRKASPEATQALRNQELAEHGCVIRAIKSATGRKATEEEQVLRLSAARRGPTMADIVFQAITPEASLEEIASGAKREMIRQFARDLENVRRLLVSQLHKVAMSFQSSA